MGWREVVANKIDTLYVSREDKRATLREAVAQHVQPGMKLNPCALQARPSAAVYEICRQFAGKNPQFEYIASSIGNTSLALLHLGLLKKAIVSFAGESYPTPGPSRVVSRTLQKGGVEFENWTMLTISERLIGGAMGVPYFPTRSLADSTIGEELARDGRFVQFEAQNGASQPVNLLQSYQPDLSFVHAWAADPAGNALCFPPYGENVYGALAAKEGVIVTADHIVDTAFLRKYPNLVRVPAANVRAVCHVPYGAHPAGNFAVSLPGFRPYGNDYDFMKDCRKAQKTDESFDAWVKEWILDVKDHAEYVSKLGKKRIDHLHFVAEPQSWRDELEVLSSELEESRPASSIENMIVQAARETAKRIRENGYRTVLSGVGQATLTAWLAEHELRKEDKSITMMAETGIYGHDPRPSDPFVFNYRNLPTTTTLTDIFETLGLHTGGSTNRCLGTIGAGQIDRFGNVNSTRNADGSFIVGSGGANDIASAACETLVVAQQRPGVFVDKVDYITSPGKHIQVVVSTMGRFEKRGGKEFTLTGYFGFDDEDKESAIREITDRCGWDVAVAEDIEALPPATDEELTLLRLFDPERLFLGKPVADEAAATTAAK